ncbi:carbohydrate ABC transporter membrane protein 2, CUT1 family (TC 3.A.1.1.-) [Streptomyces sp. WMMB 714]|uniref:carbohydrate ABC transporter permease n=1 Tax=Streptomyces sp. WMMB 714 TaxID=1286822 RepID=UPI000823DEBF|nr:carbohydrate ABC transporter permease [Streptomyces sp. WMMB 714]SCK35210.1 carbohydrate ABC transporter membrane protein 2, CUT1 family (TC 3.A.1.1.-) [Streptomyces sp. WMMB 714]
MTAIHDSVPGTSGSRNPSAAAAGRRPSPGRRLSRPVRQRLAADVGLLVIVAAFVLPLLWLLFASVDKEPGMTVSPPGSLTTDNFSAVLTDEITFTPMLNSLLLCGGATLMTVSAAALAAYPLSRYRARFARPYLLTILFTTCLPITAVMVPVYGLFVQTNLIDTMHGTSFFLATSQLPFAIWLMKNFMDGVPVALEEAAWTDGASWLQALVRVILPLMGPGFAVVTVYSFIMMWGNFFVPFMLLISPEQLPASVSIFTFFGNFGSIAYGELAAFSILYSTPVLLLYILISKRLGGGFTLGGAVKG